MCGLYGFVNYSNNKISNLSDLTNSLANQSAVRGTDATGIAFCCGSKVKILKENNRHIELILRIQIKLNHS